MSTLPIADPQHTQELPASFPGGTPPVASFAVCLPSMPSDALAKTVHQLQHAFPSEPILIASPDHAEEQGIEGSLFRLVPYPVQRTGSEWVLTAADYSAAARLAEQRGLTGVLLLGTESATLEARDLANLRQALTGGVDLSVPQYRTGPQDGLVNSALLYPLSRALFGVDIRFPLPLDAALSTRMLARLGAVVTRASANGDGSLVWPVAEASIAGYSVRQVEGVQRAIPRPQESDLNVLFPAVTSSLFNDVESKANYWQRARPLATGRSVVPAAMPNGIEVEEEEIRALVEGFRLAFSNLREIWSLVLPPQSLLQLKKLSLMQAESFTFAPNLWARVVYDFALAFHLRSLNRGHLLGAMTPLYLAWVAGLLREVRDSGGNSTLLGVTATAFEQEKPYLVSRWRWPDRFNP